MRMRREWFRPAEELGANGCPTDKQSGQAEPLAEQRNLSRLGAMQVLLAF